MRLQIQTEVYYIVIEKKLKTSSSVKFLRKRDGVCLSITLFLQIIYSRFLDASRDVASFPSVITLQTPGKTSAGLSVPTLDLTLCLDTNAPRHGVVCRNYQNISLSSGKYKSIHDGRKLARFF